MQNNSVLYPVSGHTYTITDNFEDSLTAAQLVHYASRLLENGLSNESDLDQALQKAIIACRAAGLSVARNFKAVFVCSPAGIHLDWRVSDLGLQLILLNADVSNPFVARLQVQILSGHNPT